MPEVTPPLETAFLSNWLESLECATVI